MRIDGTVDERIAGAHALALLHVDVHGTRDAVLVASPFFGLDDDAAHAFDDRTVMDDAVDFGDDRLVAGMARFEQLDDAGETAGDVFRLRRGARNLGENFARIDFLSVVNHEVGAGREEVLLLLAAFAAGLDDDRRRALLRGRGFDDDHLREAGDFVGLLADVLTFDDVLERDLAADFGEHRRGERIPLDERLAGFDVLSVADAQSGAVDE